jgi:uncharacterized protein (TIGR02996 family)
MNEERAFLQATLENPDDDALRLVFADWLEERGESRGEILRIMTELEVLERTEPPSVMRERLARVRRIGSLRRRWKELLPGIDREWVAFIYRGPIPCGGRADGEARSPCRWNRLAAETDRPFSRYCSRCLRWVRLCWTRREVETAWRSGRVAVSVVVLGGA